MSSLLSPLLAGCTAVCLLFISTLQAAEIARSADSFVESIGISTHLNGNLSYDETKFSTIGIRYFRDNSPPISDSQGMSLIGQLYSQHGIRFNLVCDSTTYTPEQFKNFIRHPAFVSIEGLNEPDWAGPRTYNGKTDVLQSNDYSATIAFQNDLFSAVTGDSTTNFKYVLSPAMGNSGKACYLKNCPFSMKSMHSYAGKEMPTGNYLDSYDIAGTNQLSTAYNNEYVATETGYRTGSGDADIPEDVQGKYIPRLLAEYFRRSINRTYLFEMVDAPNQYSYGLLRADLTEKPAYAKLHNMIDLLKETSWVVGSGWQYPSLDRGVLDYTMTANTLNVHHLLLQKEGGDFFLLLWQEIPSFATRANEAISTASATVTLAFNTPLTEAHLYNLNSLTPTNDYIAPRTLTVSVPDEVVVLRLVQGNLNVGSDPLVTVTAVDAVARPQQQPVDSATFRFTRSGTTSTSLTVAFSLAGNAVNGSDYTNTATNVTFPAGASTADLTITPSNNATIQGEKDVILTISTSSTYNLGSTVTAMAHIQSVNSGFIADFEGSSTAPWQAAGLSQLSIDSVNGDGGGKAMKWLYTDSGSTSDNDRWNGRISLPITSDQDWTGVGKLVFRFKEDSANPDSDISKIIFVDIQNNGQSVSNGYGIAAIPLAKDGNYRTFSIDLRDYPLNHVTDLIFYPDALFMETGSHIFYLDSIVVMKDSNYGLIDDFEGNTVGNWSAQPFSICEIDSSAPDADIRALRWTYKGDGVNRWSGAILRTFAQKQDWSRKTKLVIRFRENASGDAGKRIYFDYLNRGTRVSGSSGVASFQLTGQSGYRTIQIGLSYYVRDQVDGILFYIDGADYGANTHVWQIDNVTAY